MLRQVKYFQAVVTCRSFTEAAALCNISQSAISQQIQALERELGVKLLIREKRKFALTPAGEFFYQRSLGLVKEFDKLCEETVQLGDGTQPKLVIGYLKNYFGDELSYAVASFRKAYPQITLETFSGTHEELYEALLGAVPWAGPEVRLDGAVGAVCRGSELRAIAPKCGFCVT